MDITFTLQSSLDGTPLTGQSSITVYLSKDGNTFNNSTNSPTEVGLGLYKLTLTTGEASFTSDLYYQPVCTGALTNTWKVSKESGSGDTSSLSGDISKILAGILNWSMAGNTLTLYDADGEPLGTYDVTQDANGNIIKVEPSE